YTLPAHTIKQSGRAAILLLRLKCSSEPFRGEGVHVGGVVVKPADVEAPSLAVKQPRRIIADQAAANQQAHPGPKSEGLVAAKHVQAGDFQRAGWADSGTPLRVAGGGNVAGRKLNSAAIAEGPALRLLQIEENVLRRLLSFGVLDGHVHLVE